MQKGMGNRKGCESLETTPPTRRQCMTSACSAGPQLRVKMDSFLLSLPEPHINKVGECRQDGSIVPPWLSPETLQMSTDRARVKLLLSFIMQVGAPKERRRMKF